MLNRQRISQVDNIKVYLRLRPLNQLENSLGGEVCVKHQDCEVTVKINPKREGLQNTTEREEDYIHKFYFDGIFGTECQQLEIFNYVARPIVEQVMDGFNGTLFAYGQTSSGKTHTMEGPDYRDSYYKGMIPRMFDTLFELVDQSQNDIEFTVKVGMFEIYNEKIFDLLDPNRTNLVIKEDKNRGIFVQDLLEVNVSNSYQMLEVMQQGSQNKHMAATRMNDRSSRSHSLFLLKVNQKDSVTEETKIGKLFFVDLAGSEKVAKTQAEGQRLEEAKNINKSLSCLGNVINALTSQGDNYVPYRDSKLTRILQESLGGNSKTSLILTSSICSYNDREILSTLRFGNRAKNIRNKPKQNVERSAKELNILLDAAYNKINQLQLQLQSLESQTNKSQELNSLGSNENIKQLQPVQQKNALEKQNYNKKLIKQHLIIKQLSDEIEEMNMKMNNKDKEIMNYCNQLEVYNNKQDLNDEKWFINLSKFASINLMHLKKLEWKVVEYLKDGGDERVEVQEKVKSSFNDYYGILNYYEDQLLYKNTIEEKIPQNVRNQNEEQSKLIQKNLDKIIQNEHTDEYLESQEFKELHTVIIMQKEGINNLNKINKQLQSKLEVQKNRYNEKSKRYRDKLDDFAQMTQEKLKENQGQIGQLISQLKVSRAQNHHHSETIKKQNQFIESKNQQIQDMKQQIKILEKAVQQDQDKHKLALLEQEIYQIIREQQQWNEKLNRQQQQVVEKQMEVDKKDDIISRLNNQMIQQSTLIDNLKKIASNFNKKSNGTFLGQSALLVSENQGESPISIQQQSMHNQHLQQTKIIKNNSDVNNVNSVNLKQNNNNLMDVNMAESQMLEQDEISNSNSVDSISVNGNGKIVDIWHSQQIMNFKNNVITPIMGGKNKLSKLNISILPQSQSYLSRVSQDKSSNVYKEQNISVNDCKMQSGRSSKISQSSQQIDTSLRYTSRDQNRNSETFKLKELMTFNQKAKKTIDSRIE